MDVPPPLRRGKHADDDAWLASGRALIDLVARSFGRPDLAGASLLDVGCGTKFTKVILEQGLPVGRYVGIDVSAEVIAFLRSTVHDPRFSYAHLDAHNELYNPTGRPLERFDLLPVGDEPFDVIGLFSVFTHLAPHDFTTMLRLLRRHVADDGGLLFSLFIDEGPDPAARSAFERALAEKWAQDDPAVQSVVAERLAGPSSVDGRVPDFVDRIPDQPLMEAVYSEAYARTLFAGTGWEPVALHRPVPSVIQHHFVCRPV